MKKFWVNVESAKHPRPDNEQEYTAVYGKLQDAINYAWDYMLPSFGIYVVTICDENWNTVYCKKW